MQLLLPVNASDIARFLASPESILTESKEFQIAVASFPETPRNLLEILANSDNPEVAEAAQLHVNYAGELAENWQDVVDEKLKYRYLGQNDRLAVELLKIAPVPEYFLSEYVPPEYLIQGLNNPHLPLRDRLKLLERLALEPTLEPRLQVAESPDTPLPVLEQLIGDLELSIRIAVQYNPNCPPQLVKLVTGQHEVASNWDTDTQQLDSLSNSNWDWIRLAVAQNPSTSEKTLLKLADDNVSKIQLAVAKNTATPARVLSVLAEHSSKEIQAKVAKHPNATEEILHSLFDKQQGVIKSRQNLPVSILEKFFNESPKDSQKPLFLESGGFLGFFTRQPNTPTWILAEFANIDLEKLRIYAEQEYPKSPIMNQVEGWIGDRCGGLIELTKHPQVSVEILEQLASFPNQRVQLAVTQNSQTPQVLKEQLLRQLITNTKDYIKVQIAGDSETPGEILEQLSGLSSFDTMAEMLSQIAPNITPNLLNRIKEFIDRHQSPELILFWLQQGKEFQASILNDWNELLTSLNDEEREIIEYIADRNFSEEWQGKFTVQRKTSSRSHHQIEPERILLQRLMYLLNTSYNSDVSNKDIIAALLGNPSTPANLREQLWQEHQQEPDNRGRYSNDANFRIALAYNTSIPEAERMKYFEQLLAFKDCQIREYPDTSIIMKLRNIAKNPQTPTFILEQLVDSRYKSQVAENPSTPTELLRNLKTENSKEINKSIAKNPSTPLDILISLTTVDREKAIREQALKNQNMPTLEHYRVLIDVEEKNAVQPAKKILSTRKNILYVLTEISSKGVNNSKIFTAINSQTSVETLEKLIEESDRNIRHLLAYNPNLSLTAILKLARDNQAYVRKAIASKTNIPTNILETLSRDDSIYVRVEVAGNKNTPSQVLEQLSQDKEVTVRTKVAANPNTPNSVLENLALDEKIEVRHAVANNSNSSKVIKDLLKDLLPKNQNNTQSLSPTLRGLSRIYNPTTDDLPTVLSEYVDSDVAFVRFVSLLHPLIPKEKLEEGANSSSWIERYAVAQNPATPLEIKQQLTHDSNQIVRAVARDNLAA